MIYFRKSGVVLLLFFIVMSLNACNSEEKSYTEQQIAYMYQKQNPKTNVVVEVGMDSEDTEREDALKRLNSSLISGNGPDVVVLDGLPVEKYIENGILSESGSFIDEQIEKNVAEDAKAWDFVSFVLSEDVQNEIKYAGLPVNENVMKKKLSVLESDVFEVNTELGTTKEVSFTKLSDEQINDWLDAFNATKCVDATDGKMFRIIMSEGEKVIEGNTTEGDAAKEASRVIDLYINE